MMMSLASPNDDCDDSTQPHLMTTQQPQRIDINVPSHAVLQGRDDDPSLSFSQRLFRKDHAQQPREKSGASIKLETPVLMLSDVNYIAGTGNLQCQV